MRFTVAAATAIVLAMAATTASAGVVISQEIVAGNQPGNKKEQTVAIQGHKQIVISSDREVVTDLDAGKTYILLPREKHFVQAPFPPVNATQRMLARETLPIALKKTANSHQVGGYNCHDYVGYAPGAGISNFVTQCVASDAPGAKEFVDYQKAMALKVKGTQMAPGGEILDGIPVKTVFTRKVNPFVPPAVLTADQKAKIEAALARNKPFVTTMTVSKIEVKELPAETFAVPATFSKVETPAIKLPSAGQPPKPGSAPAGQGSSTKAGGAGAPAAAAPPATH